MTTFLTDRAHYYAEEASSLSLLLTAAEAKLAILRGELPKNMVRLNASLVNQGNAKTILREVSVESVDVFCSALLSSNRVSCCALQKELNRLSVRRDRIVA